VRHGDVGDICRSLKHDRRRPTKNASSSKDDDILGWLESNRIDRVANYVQRGRKNKGLSNDALFEEWKQAMRSMAKDPHDSKLRALEQDLASEIEVRGLVAPYAEVKDAIELLVSRAEEQYRKVQEDPEEYERVNEELEQDLAEFKEKRDRSRN